MKNNDSTIYTYNEGETKIEGEICVKIETKRMAKFAIKFLNTMIVIDQPDVYILDYLERLFTKYTDKITNDPKTTIVRRDIPLTVDFYLKKIDTEIRKRITSVMETYVSVSDRSNNLLSSLVFNRLTSEKLSYNRALIKYGLASPGTEVFNSDFDLDYPEYMKNFYNLYETGEDGGISGSKFLPQGKVFKFPYSSGSNCILFSNQDHGFSYSINGCLGRHIGYIRQDVLEIKEEIRCYTIGGKVCVCFIMNQKEKGGFVDGYWFKYSRPEVQALAEKTFVLINKEFRLSESFMRIDIFVTKDDKLYVNEIEPWACGKGNLCNKFGFRCEIEPELLSQLSENPPTRIAQYLNNVMLQTCYEYWKNRKLDVNKRFIELWREAVTNGEYWFSNYENNFRRIRTTDIL